MFYDAAATVASVAAVAVVAEAADVAAVAAAATKPARARVHMHAWLKMWTKNQQPQQQQQY